MDRDLTPPRAVVIEQVVVGVGGADATGEPDDGLSGIGSGFGHDAGFPLNGEASESQPVGTRGLRGNERPLFSHEWPRIVSADTGTLASPRQVAGPLCLAASESLLMLGVTLGAIDRR